jgi:hypothetical protein
MDTLYINHTCTCTLCTHARASSSPPHNCMDVFLSEKCKHISRMRTSFYIEIIRGHEAKLLLIQNQAKTDIIIHEVKVFSRMLNAKTLVTRRIRPRCFCELHFYRRNAPILPTLLKAHQEMPIVAVLISIPPPASLFTSITCNKILTETQPHTRKMGPYRRWNPKEAGIHQGIPDREVCQYLPSPSFISSVSFYL